MPPRRPFQIYGDAFKRAAFGFVTDHLLAYCPQCSVRMYQDTDGQFVCARCLHRRPAYASASIGTGGFGESVPRQTSPRDNLEGVFAQILADLFARRAQPRSQDQDDGYDPVFPPPHYPSGSRRRAQRPRTHRYAPPPQPPQPHVIVAAAYKTIGVKMGDSPEDIRTAYRALARKWHPDTNKSPAAADKMKQINAAMAVLKEIGAAA